MLSENAMSARRDRSIREIRRCLQREQHWIAKELDSDELEDVIRAVLRLQ